MAPSEPDPDDTLARLEEQLERASLAAERLLAEAAAGASASAGRLADRMKPPPAGWQAAQEEAADTARAGGDLEPVLALLNRLRELIPTELQQRLLEALRQLLLAIRGLLDWYVERLEHRRTEPVAVEDIPVL